MQSSNIKSGKFTSKSGEYSLTVKESTEQWKWSPNDYRASFEISIGNALCKGAPLRCIAEWASSLFGSFEISLGDTLNIYNYQTVGHRVLKKLPWDRAYSEAVLEGTSWLETNIPMFDEVLGPHNYRIMRWDDWKKHELFSTALAHLQLSRTTNPSFADSIKQDITEYVRRKKLTDIVLAQNESDYLSTYIMEELAVYYIQALERKTVNIYPGSPLITLAKLENFVNIPKQLQKREYAYVEVKQKKT